MIPAFCRSLHHILSCREIDSDPFGGALHLFASLNHGLGRSPASVVPESDEKDAQQSNQYPYEVLLVQPSSCGSFDVRDQGRRI
jgi:hypothetical protein